MAAAGLKEAVPPLPALPMLHLAGLRDPVPTLPPLPLAGVKDASAGSKAAATGVKAPEAVADGAAAAEVEADAREEDLEMLVVPSPWWRALPPRARQKGEPQLPPRQRWRRCKLCTRLPL